MVYPHAFRSNQLSIAICGALERAVVARPRHCWQCRTPRPPYPRRSGCEAFRRGRKGAPKRKTEAPAPRRLTQHRRDGDGVPDASDSARPAGKSTVQDRTAHDKSRWSSWWARSAHQLEDPVKSRLRRHERTPLHIDPSRPSEGHADIQLVEVTGTLERGRRNNTALSRSASIRGQALPGGAENRFIAQGSVLLLIARARRTPITRRTAREFRSCSATEDTK